MGHDEGLVGEAEFARHKFGGGNRQRLSMRMAGVCSLQDDGVGQTIQGGGGGGEEERRKESPRWHWCRRRRGGPRRCGRPGGGVSTEEEGKKDECKRGSQGE